MAKNPLCDARFPVIPEAVCRRPSDCQLKNLIHDSSCQQGAQIYDPFWSCECLETKFALLPI